MIVDYAITDGEKIAETLARHGRRSARFNGSTKEAAINGRTRLCLGRVTAGASSAGQERVRPHACLAATRVNLLGRSDQCGVDVFDDLVWAGRVDSHLVWEGVQTRCR